MKKTLVLSMVLGATVVLTGCPKEDNPGTDDTTDTTADVDTDDEVGEDETGDTGDETDTNESLTTMGMFVPEDDFGAVSECDPFMQDCPEGEKCVPYGSTGGNWDANKCVPVTGDGAAGDPCTWGGIVEATDDCDAASLCWDVMDVDGMLIGVCTEFCQGTADDPICPPGTSCLIANEGSITACITSCDPLLQDCNQGLGCFWAGNDFQCIFTTQDIAEGEACGFINDCQPGNFCAAADALPACNGSACCAAFCDMGDPVCGINGTECVEFFEPGMAPPGQDMVGVCISPA